ncbi:hypothetical protein DFJ74DRAFT_650895 [Hyaloraphidium curvatum]|nr:hypothetical protein DFJ74DRAFT_650895 [Hyaloraphidium curvatum]
MDLLDVTNPIERGVERADWNVALVATNNEVHYGPWADRQRTSLQRFFFPPTFRNQQKTELQAPHLRRFEDFVARLTFLGDTLWRIPTQQHSKDWKFPGDTLGEMDLGASSRRAERPFGWLDLRCTDGSSVQWTLPLTNGDLGYVSSVRAHILNPNFTSSVNYAVWLSGAEAQIAVTMPGPLVWNQEREWSIAVSLRSCQAWLLRDHVALLVDVAKDWSSNPGSDPDLFIPVVYKLSFTFEPFELFLCANESNVIDHPNSLADNVYLCLSGPQLRWSFSLPFGRLAPVLQAYPITVESADLTLGISFPKWSTLGSYIPDSRCRVAHAQRMEMQIMWLLCREANASTWDSISLRIAAVGLNLTSFGFLMRYLIWLKENYVGPNTTFFLAEDYRIVSANPTLRRKVKALQDASMASNTTDVRISVALDRPTVLLPSALYSGEHGATLAAPCFLLDNRNFEHYQDLTLLCKHVTVHEAKPSQQALNAVKIPVHDHWFLESLIVRGHRSFGPQPNATVYAIDWRICCASVVTMSSIACSLRMVSALKAFRKTFLDLDNLCTPYPELLDVTSLEFVVERIEACVWGWSSISSLELVRGIGFHTHDLASSRGTRSITMGIPVLLLSLKTFSDSDMHGGVETSDWHKLAPWIEVARIESGFSLRHNVHRPDWEAFWDRQRSFLKAQDVKTSRVRPFYRENVEERRDLPSRFYLPPFNLRLAEDTSFSEPLVWPSAIEFAAKSDSANFYTYSEPLATADTESPLRAMPNAELEGIQLAIANASTSKPVPLRTFGRRFQLGLARSVPRASWSLRFLGAARDGAIGAQAYTGRPNEWREGGGDASAFTVETPERGEGKKTVHLRFGQANEVLVIPACLELVQDILDSIDRESSNDPELQMDELEYGLPTPSLGFGSMHTTDFVVSLPAARLHFAQKLFLPDDFDSFVEHSPGGERTVPSHAVLVLSSLRLRLIRRAMEDQPRPFPRVGIEIDFLLGSLCLSLRLADFARDARLPGLPAAKQHLREPKHHADDDDGAPVLLDAFTESFAVSASLREDGAGAANHLHSRISGIGVGAVNQTLEILYGASRPWMAFTEELSSMLSEHRARQTHSRIQLLAALGAGGDDGRTVEATFFSYPAPLWPFPHRGERGNDTWRIFHGLRFQFHSLSPKFLDSKFVEVSKLSDDAFRVLLRGDALAILRPDSLMGAKPSRAPGQWLFEVIRSRPTFMGLQIGKFGATAFDFQNDDNAVVLGPVCLDGRASVSDSSLADLAPVAPDIVIHGSVGMIGVSLNPNVLVFLKHTMHTLSVGGSLRQVERRRRSQILLQGDASADGSHDSPKLDSDPMSFASLHGTVNVGTFVVTASAQNAIAQIRITSWSACLVRESPSLHSRSTTFSTRKPMVGQTVFGRVDQVRCSLVERSYRAEPTDSSRQLIAALLTKLMVNATPGPTLDTSIDPLAVVVALQSVVVDMPESLLGIHAFVENWRDEKLPRYGFLIQDVFKELDNSRAKGSDRFLVEKKAQPPTSHFRIQASLRSLKMNLDVLSKLRVLYDVADVLSFADIGPSPWRFAFRISRQGCRFETRTSVADTSMVGPSTQSSVGGARKPGFSLPSIGGYSSFAEPQTSGSPAGFVNAYFAVESLYSALSADIIDDLLTAQSVVGNEINDLVEAFIVARRRPQAELAMKTKGAATHRPDFALKVALERPLVKASSPSAAVLIGSGVLGGFVTNQRGELAKLGTLSTADSHLPLYWKAFADGLVLDVLQYLPENGGSASDEALKSELKSTKLATIASDLWLSNLDSAMVGSGRDLEPFRACVKKLQVVMQPSAVSTVLDFGLFYSMELDRRRMQRALDIEKLRESTTLFLRSMDVDLTKTSKPSGSLFRNKVVVLDMARVAAAVPIEGQLSSGNSRDTGVKPSKHASVGAFLASIDSVTFTSANLDINQAVIRSLCLQFVAGFDVTNEKHFHPSAHSGSLNRNRLRIPEIRGNVDVRRDSSGQLLVANGSVGGFDADLDSTLARHVSAMAAVWRSSRLRMLQVLPRSRPDSAKEEKGTADSMEVNQPPLLLNVRAAFLFERGGSVRIHPKRLSGAKHPPSNASSLQSEPGTHMLSVPSFSLTVRSENALKRRTPFKEREDLRRRMHVEFVVARSENTLFPSIVPFVAEIATAASTAWTAPDSLSANAREITVRREHLDPRSSFSELPKSLEAIVRVGEEHDTISVFLRLDTTRVDLTCQPLSRVTGTMEIDRSDALLFLTRDGISRLSTSATLKLGPVACRVRHGYASEDSFNGTVGPSTFNLALTPSNGMVQSSVLIGIPVITGRLNFRHLQDVMFLQRCWSPPGHGDRGRVAHDLSLHPGHARRQSRVLGSLASLTAGSSRGRQKLISEPRIASASLNALNVDATDPERNSNASPPQASMSVSVIVRIRSVQLAAELGHSIGNMSWSVNDAVLDYVRSETPQELRHTGLFSATSIAMRSEGRLSGHMEAKAVNFCSNMLLSARIPDSFGGDLLVLFQMLGAECSLEYQFERIIILDLSFLSASMLREARGGGFRAPLAADFAGVLGSLRAMASRRSFPTITHVLRKVTGLVGEKRAYVRSKAMSAGLGSVPSETSFGFSGAEAAHRSLSERPKDARPPDILGDSAGRVCAVVRNGFVVLFGYNFRDLDCAISSLSKLVLDLQAQHRDSEPGTRRHSTAVSLATLRVAKAAARPVGTSEERSWSNSAWFRHTESFRSIPILVLPAFAMMLRSAALRAIGTVEYSFDADFSGPVDVALNFSLYKYLMELGNLYLKALRAGNAHLDAGQGHNVAYASAETAEEPTSGPPRTAAVEEAPDDLAILRFVATGPVKFEPQLRVMGDATPAEWLEYLGVTKEKVPRLVYEVVTQPLQRILELVLRI